MHRIAPNVLLLLLLVFLLPIYQASPTPEVLALGVLLLAVALFLGYTNQARGLELLAGLTLVISFVGIAFLGRLTVGSANGAYCFSTLWLLALAGGFTLLWRRAVVVERGQILVINQLPENRALVWREGFHRPLNPGFERLMAALPAYELIVESILEHLNTESLFNVDRLELVVRCQVAEPREVVFSFPNREQARETLLRERPQVGTTGEQVAFWTELMRRQMLMEVEQAVRSTIAGIASPTEVARKRDEHARLVHERLQASVSRWGMKILDLQFLDIVIAADRIQAANRDSLIERERQDAERAAELKAREVALVGEAYAQASARMVEELVRTLKAQGTPLTSDEIERIVITAMQRVSDRQQAAGFYRNVAESGTPAATGATAQLPGPLAHPPL